jgi:cyclase
MLRPRVIVCLDVKNGRVVKGTKFRNLRDVGDPVELAARYEAEGADEIVFLDVSASKEERGTLLDVVRRTAETLFIPLTVGGGVRDADDIGPLLRAGADKISVNSAAVRDPGLLTEGARRFGSQCIVASIDAAREGAGWRCWTHGGSRATDLDAVAWAAECERRGAGEILLTSIDADGGRAGYALDLTRAVTDAVPVPVIASGGAGASEHLRDAFTEGHAAAALVAGILHDGLTTVGALKRDLAAWGVPVRPVADPQPDPAGNEPWTDPPGNEPRRDADPERAAARATPRATPGGER